ncbi:MAG: dTDP-4-dehydrorhamnose reductase [Candidatus Marinamargulisbacteria bacterium]|nr:dTDP-4-dehydrorhamnose reductase [Candidatus Marinamargulisbacteria bacterium]
MNMTAILIIGTGRLGQACADVLQSMGTVHVLSSADIDIGNPESVAQMVTAADWVVNTAAYTDVDGCEVNVKKAHRVNARGPGFVAQQCTAIQSRLIHISTDYVFDGTGSTPYRETDPVAPLSIYGHTKSLGEQSVLSQCSTAYIFRVQWLYGAGGSDFIDTMQRMGERESEVRVVADQWGAPTWTRTVAQSIQAVIAHGSIPPGVYHMPSTGYTTWYDYACAIFQKMPSPPVLTPVPTTAYSRPAKRPLNGRLNGETLARYIGPLPHWKPALLNYLESR